MLNLSDKELDRLSQQAAQEYEPGDVLGPDTWDKLQTRLDSDLGRVSANPLNHIRRWPFFYAPALLVLLGISYYYLAEHPPSARSLVKNASTTTKTATYSANSTPDRTSANPNDAAAANAASGVPTKSSAAGGSSGVNGKTDDSQSAAANGSIAGRAGSFSGRRPGSAENDPSTAKPSDSRHRRHNGFDGRGNERDVLAANGSRSAGNHGARQGGSEDLTDKNAITMGRNGAGVAGSSGLPGAGSGSQLARGDEPSGAARNGAGVAGNKERELSRSKLQGLRPTKDGGAISDSALRAFTLKSLPPGIRRNALYIKRNWQFGIVAAPDFASVNSLAGDKPGSTAGLTVDYQFAPRWYIGSGLLLDRRNYAADSQAFHAPESWYRSNNIDPKHVDFAKGSFEMLEIPLNLRYDFSVTGSTLFFATAGVSSYLLTTENGNCYYNWYGQEVPKGFQQRNANNYLFSVANLSLGVETGISNSWSILIAPYMKMPLRTIGFGQVQMNSVGISFSLKWAPVTSRKRR
ncbi:MAG TPA: hypothetical protein VHE54_00750 [Puia sp.]|nr:hypothetical protein [Puia sp.]